MPHRNHICRDVVQCASSCAAPAAESGESVCDRFLRKQCDKIMFIVLLQTADLIDLLAFVGLVHTVDLKMCGQFHLLCIHIVADVAHIRDGWGFVSLGAARGGWLGNNCAVASTF